MKNNKLLLLLVACYLLFPCNLIIEAGAQSDTIPAGIGTIENYLLSAEDGDVFYLFNDSVYSPLTTIEISKEITLRAIEIPMLPGLSNMPKINNPYALQNIIHMQDGGKLNLIGVNIDGQNSATHCISFEDPAGTISISINRCRLHDASGDIVGGSYRGTAIIKEFLIRNSFVYNSGTHGIYLKDFYTEEGVDIAPYVFEDITFWNLGQQLLWIQAFPNNSIHTYQFDHMTGWNLSTGLSKELIGNSNDGGQYIIDLTNSIFAEQYKPTLEPSLFFTTENINGADNEITLRNLVLYDVQPVLVRPGSNPIPIVNEHNGDPLYADPANGDFTIGNTAYLSVGDYGEIIGARYWHPDFVDDFSDITDYKSNSLLDSIFVNSEFIEGFKKTLFNYVYKLEAGSSIPEINYSVIFGVPTVAINNATNLNGTKEERTTTLTVTSENGSSESIYSVEFYRMSNDSTLSDLTVDASTINGFSSDTFAYLCKVNSGTTEIPTISGVVSNDSASMEIVPATNLSGTVEERTSQIIVTAEDGTSISKYSIEFHTMSSDTTLSDLTVDGSTINGFDSNVMDYIYEVSSVLDPIPPIAGIQSNDSASIEIVPATNLSGGASERTTLIHVTAEDDNYSTTYSVLFEVKPSSIKVNYSESTFICPTIVQNGFSVNHFEEVKRIDILSLSGRSTSIKMENNSSERIDVSFLKAGLYIVLIISDSGTYPAKLIKQ